MSDHRDAIRSIAETRRSIRRFKQEPFDQDDLREILRLTGLAPSSGNVQTWRFAVVQSEEAKARLIQAMTGNNPGNVESAPVSIVLYSDGPAVLENLEEIFHPGLGAEEIEKRATSMRANLEKKSKSELEEWARTHTFIALGYLLLVIRGFGYDSVAMGGWREDDVKEALGLPETARVTAIISLGKRDQEGFSHHRHEVEAVTSWH